METTLSNNPAPIDSTDSNNSRQALDKINLTTIRRVDALREMELREDPTARRRIYSLQFYKQNGEVVTLQHCYTCGLRANMKQHRLIGVQPCDRDGNPQGHIHTVSIDNLREYNHRQIIL